MELTINKQGESFYTGDKFLDQAINDNFELFSGIDFKAPLVSLHLECLGIARNKIDNEQFVREMLVECMKNKMTPADRAELFGRVFYQDVKPQFITMYLSALKKIVVEHGEEIAIRFVKKQISDLRNATVLQLLTRKWEVQL